MSDENTIIIPTEQLASAEKTTKKPAIKRGWIRAIIGLFLITILSSLSAILLLFTGTITLEMLKMSGNDSFNAMGINVMALVMLLQAVTAFLIICFLRRFIDKESVNSLGFSLLGYKTDLLKGLGWGAAMISVGFVALYVSGFITITNTDFIAVPWFGYLGLFLFVALFEEILVRGYVLTNLMASMNKYWALVVSSLIFSVMHLANDNVSILPTINLFLAGILLGIYTIHKRNLWFPIAMHFTWNFMQGPVLGFEVSGLKTDSFINQQIAGHELITGGQFGFEGSILLTVMMIAAIYYLDRKYKS